MQELLIILLMFLSSYVTYELNDLQKAVETRKVISLGEFNYKCVLQTTNALIPMYEVRKK